MSATPRTPPNLQYLTIYNPTIRPQTQPPPDDEDAEEAAHILFYTSKERAVSRDRMLRQVGLAKALVNFSEIFTPDEPCNNIHSQTRRMVMISPEPDFWIHACVELARSTRPATIGRSKGKSGTIGRSKGKEPALVMDYEESSVDDIALRQDLLRGYEKFKLKHGSLTTILDTLGYDALSLQLERFFTPWAWSWEIEESNRFGNHLGLTMHPKQQHITRLLDSTYPDIPTLIITPSHVIPSTTFSNARLPSGLPRLISTLLPPPPPPPLPSTPSDASSTEGHAISEPTPTSKTTDSAFLGIPTMNMNLKLNWPGYLTFKSGNKRPPEQEKIPPSTLVPPGDDNKLQESRPEEAVVDKLALADAINSNENPSSLLEASVQEPNSLNANPYASEVILPSSPQVDLPESPVPPPEISSTSIYLAPPDNPLQTERRKVHFLTTYPIVLAFVTDDPPEPALVQKISYDVLGILDQDSLLSSSAETLPSAAKILQPKDRHIISRGGFIISNENFESPGEQLYIAQRLFENDPDIQEVFSRGVNPQYWHIARRGWDQEVYMEVLRKETTLSDVDNLMLGVIRKFTTEAASPTSSTRVESRT